MSRKGGGQKKQNTTKQTKKQRKKRKEERKETPLLPRYLGAWNRLLKITIQCRPTVPVPLVTLSFWTTERIVFYACPTPEKFLPIWKKKL